MLAACISANRITNSHQGACRYTPPTFFGWGGSSFGKYSGVEFEATRTVSNKNKRAASVPSLHSAALQFT